MYSLSGDGSCLMAGSIFDVTPDEADQEPALMRAAEFARANGQTVAWDASRRWYAIALFDHESKRLQALPDDEAGILINRDPQIRRAWCKWNRASKNNGSLVVLDASRARRVLGAARQELDGDDGMQGLA